MTPVERNDGLLIVQPDQQGMRHEVPVKHLLGADQQGHEPGERAVREDVDAVRGRHAGHEARDEVGWRDQDRMPAGGSRLDQLARDDVGEAGLTFEQHLNATIRSRQDEEPVRRRRRIRGVVRSRTQQMLVEEADVPRVRVRARLRHGPDPMP